MKRKIDIVDVIVLIIVTIVIIVVTFPLLNVLSTSLSSSDQVIRGNVTFFPRGFSLETYKAIMKNGKIVRAYGNSFLYTISAMVISLILVTIMAYPLSRKFLPGRKIILSMVIFTMVFSGGLIPIYMLIQGLKLMNTMWALVLPWAIPAYEMFLLKNYFENIPEAMYEAATIDGANDFWILTKIFIPLAKPIFATLAIFFALNQWNSYMTPLMYITSQDKYPLQLILQNMLMQETAKSSTTAMEYAALTSQGMKSATIVISIIPLLVFYPFIQRYFIDGMYAGAVKG
jgi:putative aldouronate transport system permease protein